MNGSNLKAVLVTIALVVCTLLFVSSAHCQQPQTSSPPQALQGINAKWTNGVGPGFWVYQKTGSCTGLVVCVSAGTCFDSAQTRHAAAATTLTMTASNTNYVSLAPSNCALTQNTTGYGTNIPVATAIAGGSTLSSITDDRTWFSPAASTSLTAHGIAVPLTCADASGSGAAQTCTTSPSFTPAAKDCVNYTPGTTNTGALTLNVNSSSAAPVQKWLGTTMVAGDAVAGKTVLACYDGTNWQVMTIGNPPSGGTTWNAITSPTGAQTLAMGTNKSTWTANSQSYPQFYYDPANGFGFTTDIGATAPDTAFTTTAPRGVELRNHGDAHLTISAEGNSSASYLDFNNASWPNNARTPGASIHMGGSTTNTSLKVANYTGGSLVDHFLFDQTGIACVGNSASCLTGSPVYQFEIWPDSTNRGLNLHMNNNGANDALDILNFSKLGLYLQRNSVPTAFSFLNSYIHLGGFQQGFGTNGQAMICGGEGDSNDPLCFGYQQTNSTDHGQGYYVVATRYATNDIAPKQRNIVGAQKAALTNNTATSFLDIPTASNSTSGGIVRWCSQAGNGTDFQSDCGQISYACVNKAGTMTSTINGPANESNAVSGGTLTVSFTGTTGTAKCTVQVTSNSSLSGTVTTNFNYSVDNFSTTNDVTPL